MKQIFLTLLLFFPLSLMAQEETDYEYQPFVVEGKTWYTHYCGNVSYENWKFFITGDTIFNEHNCKKLMLYVGESLQTPYLEMKYKKEGDAFVWAYIYEDNKKVYVTAYPKTPYQYRDYSLLYDFGMNVGDKQQDMFVVSSVDTTEIYGVKRRVMHVDVSGGREELWIEGIGTRCPIGPGYSARMGVGWDFLSCVDNGNIVFTGDLYDWIYYKDADKISLPQTTNTKYNYNDFIYDLQGRRVTTPQKGGLYIRNGRKFLYN